MKEIILAVIGIAVIFLYGSGIEISFNPFSVKLGYWTNGLGYVFIVLGILLLCGTAKYRGRIEGYDEGSKYVIEQIKKQK